MSGRLVDLHSNSGTRLKSRIEPGSQCANGVPDSMSQAESIRDVVALANSKGEPLRKEGHLIVGVKDGRHYESRNENGKELVGLA
jgi:predicted HTH transcriptional regulator